MTTRRTFLHASLGALAATSAADLQAFIAS